MRFDGGLAAVLLAAWIVQAVVAPSLAVAGVIPDVMLVAVALVGFTRGAFPGTVLGFFGGLLLDLSGVGSVGAGALVYSIVGFASGRVERTLFGSSALLPALALSGVTALSHLLRLGVLTLLGESAPPANSVVEIVLFSAAYTAVVAFPLYGPLARWLSRERPTSAFQ